MQDGYEWIHRRLYRRGMLLVREGARSTAGRPPVSLTMGSLRIACSVLMVVVAFTLAALAHTATGGRLPSPVVLVPIAVPVIGLAYLATSRFNGWRVTAVLQVGMQAVLHHALSVLGGHQMDSASSAAGSASAALMPHPGLGSLGAVAVLGLQVTATVLAVAALAALERVVWHLWAWLRPLVVALLGAVLFPSPWCRGPVESDVPMPTLRRLGRRRRRRGPPPAPRTLGVA